MFFEFLSDLKKCADEDQHHFVVDFENIFPDAENDTAEFTNDRDDVFGVVSLLLVSVSLEDDIPINGARLDPSAQLEQELTT